MPEVIKSGADNAPIILFAHGAGAGMYSDFMEDVCQKLVALNLQVVRFEFDYMSKIRETGRKRPPERVPKLIEQFHQAIAQCNRPPSLLLGKSMGGRVATMVGREVNIKSAALGYPFHAIGRTVQDDRIAHLLKAGANTKIFQGSIDNMGSFDEITAIEDSLKNTEIHWFEAANHDLKPRASAQGSQESYLHSACEEIRNWVQ